MFLTFLLCLRYDWSDIILVSHWLPFLSKVSNVVLVGVGTDLIKKNSCGAVFYKLGFEDKNFFCLILSNIALHLWPLVLGCGEAVRILSHFFRSRSTS